MTSFIDSQQAQYPDLANKYERFGALSEEKLWYQLTEELVSFVSEPSNSRGRNFIDLFENFIATFWKHLDDVKVAYILGIISKQFYPSRVYVLTELEAAIAFLNNFKSYSEQLSQAANFVLDMNILLLKTYKLSCYGSCSEGVALLDEIKKELSAGETRLNLLPSGQDTIVPASFHKASAEFYRIHGPAASFYASALQYLSFTPLESLQPAEKHTFAVDIALAALVADNVYSFGDINAHPILQSLHGTPQAWLVSLLSSFQTGDIDLFNRTIAENQAAFNSQAALTAAAPTMKEKISILAAMELALKRDSKKRSLTFSDLASTTQLPEDQVEWLMMRAMSLGLIKGTIDQVDKMINISFVKPRVLNMEQIAAMKLKIEDWTAKTTEVLTSLNDRAEALLA